MSQFHEEDELVDIVNEHDHVIDTQWRTVSTANNVPYRRVVLAFIINNENKFGIFKRAAHKSHAPGQLALVGGGVKSGETYDQAMIREIAEEINVSVSQSDLRCLGYLKPHEDYLGFFKKIYEIRVDTQTVPFNPADFSDAFWMHSHELDGYREQHEVANGLDFLLAKYYENKKD